MASNTIPPDINIVPTDKALTNMELIYQFRTITTMLKVLREAPTSQYSGCMYVKESLITQERELELQVLDALSTILVRNHETVAVVSKPGDRIGKYEIIACAHFSKDQVALPTALNPQHELKCTTTDSSSPHPEKNQENLESTSSDPSQVHDGSQDNASPAIPTPYEECKDSHVVVADSITDTGTTPPIIKTPGLKIDINDPLAYVRKNWKSLSYDEYGRSVADILNQCIRPSFSYTNVMRYIVAMCFEKMYRRLNHPEYGKPLYDSLIQAKVSSLDFPEHAAKVTRSPYDKRIVDVLPTLIQLTNIKIPNLEAALLKDDYSVPIYTRETYKDFHEVLRVLLTGFCSSLEELAQIQESELDQKLELYVRRVTFFGGSLRVVANSSMFETHLQTITSLLEYVHDRKKKDEEDSDLASIQASTLYESRHSNVFSRDPIDILGQWESYRDWLRLIISPFDAVRVLTGYIQRIQPHLLAISMTVIAIPDPGKKMLPWRKLLEMSFSDTKSRASMGDFVERVIRSIDTLQDSSHVTAYFREHFGAGSKLSRGRFSGLLHCEACIASLIYSLDETLAPNQDDYEMFGSEFSGQGDVIGVSKWSCPVCTDLFDILQRRRGWKRFFVRRSHRTVYPCTLPLWLPHAVIEEMVSTYRDQLKGELYRLLEHTEDSDDDVDCGPQ